jgi:hypothetical protein
MTHEPSARQLPTNDDHEGGPRPILEYQRDQPSTAPRSATDSLTSREGAKKNKNADVTTTGANQLAGSFHINVSAFSCKRERELRAARRPTRLSAATAS